MKNLKDQKGITLVALVITIIVLLILAGVSLSLVVGDNGILGRASNTAIAQREAEVREKVLLELVNLESEYYQYKYSSSTTDTAKVSGYGSAVEYALDKLDATQIKGVTVTVANHSKTSTKISFNNGVDTVYFTITNNNDNFDFAPSAS